MGVPLAIIIMIALMMSMFGVIAIVIFKNRKNLDNHTINPYPPSYIEKNNNIK